MRALARSDASAAALAAAGAEPVRGDILDPASLVPAMAGAEVVYHVAGVNGFCFPDPAVLDRGNVDGTRNVVRAAAAAGVRRIVYTSSAATIGEEAGTVGDRGLAAPRPLPVPLRALQARAERVALAGVGRGSAWSWCASTRRRYRGPGACGARPRS